MPPAARRPTAPWFLAFSLAACAGGRPGSLPAPRPGAATAPAGLRPSEVATPGALPPIPESHGALRIQVVYPDSTARVDVGDSTFAFGSVGDGAAVLRINETAVRVAPNGAWLAWIPVPADSTIVLRLTAHTATDSAHLEYRIRRVPRFAPADSARLWVDTTSFEPAGRVWWPADEYLPISVRAKEGASLALVLPNGIRVPLAPDRAADQVPAALRAFDRDTLKLRTASRGERYRAELRNLRLGDPGPLFGPGAGTAGGEALLLAASGSDTLRVRWPLRLVPLDSLPISAELDDDRAGKGGGDGITVGRATPAGTYTWFFPTGTRSRVSGRINGEVRLAIARGASAWVAAAEAWPAAATPGPAVVGSVTLSPRADRVVARIPVGRRIPFQVLERERELTLVLYEAVSNVNWLRYGPTDPLVALSTTRQVSADQLELSFELSAPVWGYRTRWDGTDLLFEIRRPPVIDPASPLRGRFIAVDPGHPPAGATGPTGLHESEANLAIGLLLRDLLEAEGARVYLTRTGPGAVDLWPRQRAADSAGAEILLSIHNNALPDGVNPFTNNGTSAFYNHPRALPLARDIVDRLVARTGLRDLGAGRGDLALVRPTWMPAVLSEGLFLMIPQQEAALRNPDGQRLYALAVLEGLKRFLARRASGEW
ncbi:MAG TPA: N-acetylmuramoyl-L-alanine amidase [Gemmatimonadales bacterium]|nr:N-acetylmuramoyl-L-alanine amidase [Gemmatimonadales bacterium]